jgi:hypothetical protein
MLDTPLSEVLHGKYAIRLLCNECHRTKDKWAYPLALNDPLTGGMQKCAKDISPASHESNNVSSALEAA